jgi:hypothetical protein
MLRNKWFSLRWHHYCRISIDWSNYFDKSHRISTSVARCRGCNQQATLPANPRKNGISRRLLRVWTRRAVDSMVRLFINRFVWDKILSCDNALTVSLSLWLFVIRFCGLKGHEMFCEVERSYIEDGFNLYGLRACVSNFSDCLDLILDRIGPDDSDDSHLTQNACTLYGLIHARYIITAHGLDAMYNKVWTWVWQCAVLSLCYCWRYLESLFVVCGERVWHMSVGTMFGSTCITGGPQRRNWLWYS